MINFLCSWKLSLKVRFYSIKSNFKLLQLLKFFRVTLVYQSYYYKLWFLLEYCIIVSNRLVTIRLLKLIKVTKNLSIFFKVTFNNLKIYMHIITNIIYSFMLD